MVFKGIPCAHLPVCPERPEEDVLWLLCGEADGGLYFLKWVDANRDLFAVAPIGDVKLLLDIDKFPDFFIIIPDSPYNGAGSIWPHRGDWLLNDDFLPGGDCMVFPQAGFVSDKGRECACESLHREHV